MLPIVNEATRSAASMNELILGVKCGGSDGFSGLSANPALGRAADLLVRSGGTVLITEVPEFCGAEHILAQRSKDRATGEAVYEMVDWYKEYASKFGTVLNENPSPGNVAGGLLNITIKSLGAIAKAGTTRVEGVTGYAELPGRQGAVADAGPRLRPGVDAGPRRGRRTGRGVHDGARHDDRQRHRAGGEAGVATRPCISACRAIWTCRPGGIIDGTETIDEVGARVFEHVRRVASGEVQAKAEETKHREFGIWAEQSVSL